MNPLRKLTLALLSLNAIDFTTISILLGYLLSDGLNATETSSLGNFFESVGQVLETLGAQMFNNEDNNSKPNTKEIYQEIKKKISNLDEIIADLNNIKN